MKNKIRNSEKGFALPLALLLVSGYDNNGGNFSYNIHLTEHNANNDKDKSANILCC
jgi:hypothetical protein